MRQRLRFASSVLLLVICLAQLRLQAMDLPHYDLDSLVFLSTDVVVATIAESEPQQFTATVVETLYGTLKAGDRIEKLKPFLSFFQPMHAGLKLVLFLDRRPHQYDFFHSEAAKSPFAVPPSGVYLVDEYEHVHQYYQLSNPGSYVAEGYSYFLVKSEPTKEQDLALVSLAEEKERITASVKKVEMLRPLLERDASGDDAPALFAVLDTRSREPGSCFRRGGSDAIVERAAGLVESLHDPLLLLKLQQYHVDQSLPEHFVQQNGARDAAFAARRVQYLLRTIADRRAQPALRVAAAEIVVNVAAFHSSGQAGPLDNEWLSPSAAAITKVANDVFENKHEPPELRSLCLRLLALDQSQTVADIKRVYLRTNSTELRFNIEKAFLGSSDTLYRSLDAGRGPMASILSEAPEANCLRPVSGNVVFHARYREMQAVRKDAGFSETVVVLTNLRTGERIVPAPINNLAGWGGMDDGEFWFELSRTAEIPLGSYSIGLEYHNNSQVLSAGYPAKIEVRENEGKKIISALGIGDSGTRSDPLGRQAKR